MSGGTAYQFYPIVRLCPSCGARLVTATPVTRTHLQGPLQRLGITCYCVRCNTRYRATSKLPFAWVGWMGPLGHRIWWQTTLLEVTLRSEGP